MFLRTGTLVVTSSMFTDNQVLAGAGGSVAAAAGKARAGAIFSMVPAVTLTGVTFSGSVAADAGTTATDSVDLYVMP